jgi:hypothetical protein
MDFMGSTLVLRLRDINIYKLVRHILLFQDCQNALRAGRQHASVKFQNHRA